VNEGADGFGGRKGIVALYCFRNGVGLNAGTMTRSACPPIPRARAAWKEHGISQRTRRGLDDYTSPPPRHD